MTQFQGLNVGLAFLEGFALILSPCILPILPIVLAGTATGGRRRLWGILLGFVLVFALFTVFSRVLVQHLGLDPNRLRWVGFGLILVFGIILIINPLSALFSRVFEGLSRFGQASPEQPNDGFISGCVLGASLSLIWVPCGGPILAAAIVQSAVQKTYVESVLILCFFALGSIIPLLLIGTVGRKLITQLQFLKAHSVLIRQMLGVIMILSALWALSGPQLPDKSPMVDAPNIVVPTVKAQESLIGGLAQPYPAPALRGITEWINSPPLSLSAIKGQVVLVDFWTYSCINCVRTIPELNAWYKAYHDKGLVIIGIHSPEFEFEKNVDNVKRAVAEYQIHYPVGLDNNYGTWISFHNIYWPAQYLIDRNGMVVYENFGEGNAEVTEQNILTLLNIPGIPLSAETPHLPKPSEALQTPELYFGSKRASAYGGVEPLSENNNQQYTLPDNIPKDGWALSGGWKVEPERIISTQQHTRIACRFFAGKVFGVMGSVTDHPVTVTVLLNGHPIGPQGGKDVTNSQLVVSGDRLYELAVLPEADAGLLTLDIDAPGLAMYTFTFGI